MGPQQANGVIFVAEYGGGGDVCSIEFDFETLRIYVTLPQTLFPR